MIYHPDQIKEVMASYYENLYAKKEVRPHPHHEIVQIENQRFLVDKNKDHEWYNQPPSVGPKKGADVKPIYQPTNHLINQPINQPSMQSMSSGECSSQRIQAL